MSQSHCKAAKLGMWVEAVEAISLGHTEVALELHLV